VNRLRKYIELMPDGQELRLAYAMSETALPDARPRSRWQEIILFSAADEVMAEPGLKSVFKAAIERGFAIVPESGLSLKAKAK
jgi:hypothetical protein